MIRLTRNSRASYNYNVFQLIEILNIMETIVTSLRNVLMAILQVARIFLAILSTVNDSVIIEITAEETMNA